MHQRYEHEESVLEVILHEDELIEESTHKSVEHMALFFRNIVVVVAALMFLLSLIIHSQASLFRGTGYILGAIAYFCELVMLTDGFSRKAEHDELFMIYCFGPLYILMGVVYFLEHAV